MKFMIKILISLIISSCQIQTQSKGLIECLETTITDDYATQIITLENFFIEKGLVQDANRQSYVDLISSAIANPSERRKMDLILNKYKKEIPRLSDTFVIEYCCEKIHLDESQEICTLVSRISRNGLTLETTRDFCQKWTDKEFKNHIVLRGTVLLFIWYDLLYRGLDRKN